MEPDRGAPLPLCHSTNRYIRRLRQGYQDAAERRPAAQASAPTAFRDEPGFERERHREAAMERCVNIFLHERFANKSSYKPNNSNKDRLVGLELFAFCIAVERI